MWNTLCIRVLDSNTKSYKQIITSIYQPIFAKDCNVQWSDRISNEELWMKTDQEPVPT